MKSKDDLPALVTRLSRPARRAMMVAMLEAEGDLPHAELPFTNFPQNPGPVMEAYRILATLEGFRLGNEVFVDAKKCDTRRVALMASPVATVSSLRRTKVKDAPSWCPTTAYGTWVMQWNRQIAITGNSDGVMTWALKYGPDHGWGCHEICYKENLEPHGWLLKEEVERKRKELPDHVFAVEIELQEPAVEGRAFMTDKIENMFSTDLGFFKGLEGDVVEIEKPNPNLRYVHGLDLARKKDYTVMVTMRIDVTPFRIVAFRRYRRRGWDEIGAKVDEVMARWGGYCLFDETGIGDPVSSTFKSDGYEGYQMVGKNKQELLNDYVAGVERDEVIGPRIHSMYDEHKFCRVDDLQRTGEGFHLPDTVQAGALAYRAAILSVGGDIRVVNLGNTGRERTDFSEIL